MFSDHLVANINYYIGKLDLTRNFFMVNNKEPYN